MGPVRNAPVESEVRDWLATGHCHIPFIPHL
jgi:hypothetical protein